MFVTYFYPPNPVGGDAVHMQHAAPTLCKAGAPGENSLDKKKQSTYSSVHRKQYIRMIACDNADL